MSRWNSNPLLPHNAFQAAAVLRKLDRLTTAQELAAILSVTPHSAQSYVRTARYAGVPIATVWGGWMKYQT
jgi:predicted DNA-binding transcriptional regulator YafY